MMGEPDRLADDYNAMRRERDALRERLEERESKLAGEAAHIKSLEGLLVDACRERDEARRSAARLRAALRGLFKPDGVPYAQWTREMHEAHIVLESER